MNKNFINSFNISNDAKCEIKCRIENKLVIGACKIESIDDNELVIWFEEHREDLLKTDILTQFLGDYIEVNLSYKCKQTGEINIRRFYGFPDSLNINSIYTYSKGKICALSYKLNLKLAYDEDIINKLYRIE